jgi:hypothetical protein
LVIPDRTFVVDVDPRNGGDVTMQTITALYGELPHARARCRTRSRRRHHYYRLPDDRDIRGKLGPGVDIKKPGRGYVLVPPTAGYTYVRGGRPPRHPSGCSTSCRSRDGCRTAPHRARSSSRASSQERRTESLH